MSIKGAENRLSGAYRFVIRYRMAALKITEAEKLRSWQSGRRNNPGCAGAGTEAGNQCLQAAVRSLAEGNHEDSREGANVVEIFAHLQNAALIVHATAEASLYTALFQRVLKNLACDGTHLARCSLITGSFVRHSHAPRLYGRNCRWPHNFAHPIAERGTHLVKVPGEKVVGSGNQDQAFGLCCLRIDLCQLGRSREFVVITAEQELGFFAFL